VLDVDPKTRIIYAHASDGVRTFRLGDRFKHPAIEWLEFPVNAVFAELDELSD
jgi:hypothetical protein